MDLKHITHVTSNYHTSKNSKSDYQLSHTFTIINNFVLKVDIVA